MKKEILIICATHGNEKIGIGLVKKLKEKKLRKYFDYLIANPKALKKNVRFLDCDLNRSYPGIENSEKYEEKRAFEIFKTAKEYKYVIDMHEASSGINNFIIVPRKTIGKLFPINLIDLNIALLWPNPKGPLSQVLKNAIELEFGMKNKNREAVVGQAVKIVESFIERVCLNKPTKKVLQKKVYYVYGKLNSKDFEGKISGLKDFRKTKLGEEEFCPLLIGQYLKDGIVCYKMKEEA